MAMAMARLRLAVVLALALFCCLIHAPTTGAGLEVVAPPSSSSSSCGTDDQAMVAGEAGGGSKRMDLELEDYPGSGANDRHSPWAQQRRN